MADIARDVPADRTDETDAGRRPTADLPIGHLVRISLYWLGLTAIDGAVGVFTQNRLNFDGFAPELEVGRIGVVSTALYSIDRSLFQLAARDATARRLVRPGIAVALDATGTPITA